MKDVYVIGFVPKFHVYKSNISRLVIKHKLDPEQQRFSQFLEKNLLGVFQKIKSK